MSTVDLSESPWERRLPLLAVSLLGALFLAVLYRTAWLCDDAYITYRTIDNAVNGYGLRFNVGERVQTYTHPLWMFLHLPFRALSGNMYAVGMFVSIGTSLAAMGWMVWKLARNHGQMAFVLLAAVFSRAFMDYSTSGLENPLTHLLIGVFAWVWLEHPAGRRRLFWLAFVTGLAVTNRMDTLLLLAPALGLEFWRQRSWRNVGTVALGLSVFILWEIFSVIYYGFPFPNTAYAKLNHGFESSLMWKQGFYYLLNSLSRDPITLLTVFSAAAATFIFRQKRLLPLVLGMLLYMLYVTKIGAGFMSGRFYTGPFFMALIVIIYLDIFPKDWSLLGPLLGLTLLVGWVPGKPTILSGKDFIHDDKGSIDAHGIADERAFYFFGTGLSRAPGKESWPEFRWANDGRETAAKPDSVHIGGNMGFLGFYAGPRKHLIDIFALTDPLMSHLPNRFMPDWRPGHYERMVPYGYKKSVETGENHLQDPTLRVLYDDVKLLTQAPLFDGARWKAIWRMNMGIPQAAIDRPRFFHPVTQDLNYADLSTPQPEDQAWDAPENKLFNAITGLRISLPEGLDLSFLNARLCAKCWYVLVFRKDGKRLHQFVINGIPKVMMNRACHALPASLNENVPDELLIYTLTDWRKCSLSDLQLTSTCME